MSKNHGRVKILFIGEAVTLSHVARPFVLLNTLDPGAFAISFAFDPKYRELFPLPEHVEYIPLHSRMARKSLERIALMLDEFYDLSTLEQYIQEDAELIRRVKPDVIVGDMRQSLIISARLAGIPFVTIQNAHWHPQSDMVFHSPINPLSAFLPYEVSANWYDTFLSMGQPFATFNQTLLCLKYGVNIPGPSLKAVLSEADYILFPDIPEWTSFDVPPDNATYVGPLSWAPQTVEPSWWQTRDPTRDAIYIGLGSSGQIRLLQTIVDVVSGFPVDVIISTAGRIAINELPEGVYVADYLDGGAVARIAKLAICNGGSTSGPQALAQGCPILGITSNLDQAGFMAQIVKLGAGVSLDESEINPEVLRRALATLLADPGYRKAAMKIGNAMNRIDPGVALRAILDKATRSKVRTAADASTAAPLVAA